MFKRIYNNGYLVIGLIFFVYYSISILFSATEKISASETGASTSDMLFTIAIGFFLFLNLFLVKKAAEKKGLLRVFVFILTSPILLFTGSYLVPMIGGLAAYVADVSHDSNTIFDIGEFPNFIPFFVQIVLLFLVNFYALFYLSGFFKDQKVANKKLKVIKIFLPVFIIVTFGVPIFGLASMAVEEEMARYERKRTTPRPVFSGGQYTTENVSMTLTYKIDDNVTFTNMNSDTELFFNDIYFMDKDNGVSVGGPGLLISTTHNAGKTWKRMFNTRFSDSFKAVDFINKKNGIAVGSSKIYFTKDGGDSWNFYNPELPRERHKEFRFFRHAHFWDVKYITKDIIIIVGDNIIIRTTDGGKKWNKIQYQSPKKSRFRSVKFINKNIGWIVGSHGVVLKSLDSGETWRYVDTGYDLTLFDIEFFSNEKAYIVGNNIQLITTDSGATWKKSATGASVFSKMIYSGDNIAWVIQNSSFAASLRRTVNGGKTWRDDINFSNSTNIFGIHPLDGKTIFVSGNNGTRVKIEYK